MTAECGLSLSSCDFKLLIKIYFINFISEAIKPVERATIFRTEHQKMGLQAEDLAFDSGLQCDMCSESVNYGEDYIAHLKIVHSINKNFNFFLNKAKETIKGGQKRKADVITLSDEEEEEISNGPDGSNTPQIDEDVKKRIETVVEKTFQDMLDPIKKLLEGKVTLETENLSIEDFDEDPGAADEKIWEAFNKLKMSINNLEFPEEVLQSLNNPQRDEPEDEETLQETVQTKNRQSAKKDEKFKHPSSNTQKSAWPQRKGSKMSPNLPDNKSKPTTVTGGSAKDSGKNSKPPASSQKTQARPGTARSIPRKANAPASTAKVASPAKSDMSARSGTSSEASSPKTRATRYCCPLKDCTFSIDKAGLLGGEAASHISKIHKVTAEAMKTAPKGYYKFKKVKAEAGA